MTKILTIQPASFVDQVIDGHEFYKKPYPLSVDRDGNVQFQDFWQGYVYRVIGFQSDPDVMTIDYYWTDLFDHPESMIGLYPVVSTKDSQWSTHISPVESFFTNEDGHS